MTEEGILSIFNGKPYKSHIIQSFFQIDVGKLESHKREELKEGIPIKTKDQYIEVLRLLKRIQTKISKQIKELEKPVLFMLVCFCLNLFSI